MAMIHAVRCSLVLGLLSSFASVGAQSAGGKTDATPPTIPTYDVATIKPNTKGGFHSSVWTENASLRTENVLLRDLLQTAFGVRRSQIIGLPPWTESIRYDINAKIVEPDMAALKKLSVDQRRAMLRAFYEERFGLKWHYETKVMSAYELVVGKDGPKFKPAAGGADDSDTSMNNTDLTATNISMSSFTDILSQEVERPVVDRTGLAGKFDLKLKWTRESNAGKEQTGEDADAPPPLFTALQEQLGLKLQPGKDPVQTLVIDGLTQPAEN